MKNVNMFEIIEVPVSTQPELEDISVSVDSTQVKLLVESLQLAPKVSVEDSKVVVEPDIKWFPGSVITITIEGINYVFKVPHDYHLFSPDHFLYSNNLVSSSNKFDVLLKEGYIDPEELALIQSLGDKGHNFLVSLSKALVSIFPYSGNLTIEEGLLARGLRRAQQLMHILGLEVLIEYILFSPGPESKWFIDSRISGSRLDGDVVDRVSSLESAVMNAISTMQKQGLDTDILDSLPRHISPNEDMYEVVRAITTLFLLLRYNHDNPRFKY